MATEKRWYLLAQWSVSLVTSVAFSAVGHRENRCAERERDWFRPAYRSLGLCSKR
jgi:hypothetical protein